VKRNIESYREEIKMLKLDYETERSMRLKVERELSEKTAWIQGKFEWWSELLSESKTPCLKYLIKDTARILGAKVKS